MDLVLSQMNMLISSALGLLGGGGATGVTDGDLLLEAAAPGPGVILLEAAAPGPGTLILESS